MTLGFLWMLVANAAALLGAHALTRRIGTGEGSLDAVLFLLVRLLLISAAIIVAGLTRTLSALGLGLLGAAALAVLIAFGAHRRLRWPTLPMVGLVMGVFASLVLARLLAQVWFFAPYFMDTLSYHLPKVAEWVRAGAFTREMGVDTHASFPAGFELVETWWVVFLHHDVLIEMAGVEYLVLAFVATYALAKHVGITDAGAFFAGLVYVMTPGLHLQATSCANDGPVSALVVATAALAARHAPLPLLLLSAGLGIGVKATYLYALPGLGLLWMLSRKETALSAVARKLGVGLAAGALLVGAFWYVHNIIWYGSPTYPVGLQGLSGPHPIQLGPRISSLVGNVSSLIDPRIYDSAAPQGPYTVNISGWGAAAFACGLLALLAVTRTDARVRRMVVAFAVSAAFIFLHVLHDPWSIRFILFIPAILSIAAVRLAEEYRPILVVLGASLLLNFLGTMLPHHLPLRVFGPLAQQPWRDRSLANVFDAWPPSDCVGYFADNRNIAYLLYRPDYSSRVVYLRARSAEGLVQEMEDAGVRYVYAAPASIENHEILKGLSESGRLRVLKGRFYVRE
ncbi:MAG: hypothetical protein ACK44W_04185 [Planctomycetota bacterium]